MLERVKKKIKTELPCDPKIPLLGIYSEKTILQKDTCPPVFIAALFTIARSWKPPKCPSTDKWIKKMWYIYTMEYYSTIKMEQNWVICTDVDESRDCHTEWSKSVREKQISYINAYMWNLEKWYRWAGLQGRNRDTDVENKCMDTRGESRRWGRWDELGDWDWHIYNNMYKIDN